MTTFKKSLATLAALVAILCSALVSQAAPPRAAARQSIAVMPPRPGSVQAAKGLRAYVRTKGGILVKNKMVLLTNPKLRMEQARWAGMRHAVKRYLSRTGVRPAPLAYQRLVKNVRQRAEKVLNRHGSTLGSWKTIAVEGGQANVVNAAAWTGGLITINRPLIDLAFQIGRVVDAAKGNQAKIDKGLHNLATYRRGKGQAPLALQNPLSAKARRVAEGIVAGVVMHEMGHAANGHLQMRDAKLWLPGQKGASAADRGKTQRAKERQADDFMAQLGALGGTHTPSAIPYFNYYMHIANPRWNAKRPLMIADISSHPLNAKRYEASRKTLTKMLPKNRAVNSLPELSKKLIVQP